MGSGSGPLGPGLAAVIVVSLVAVLLPGAACAGFQMQGLTVSVDSIAPNGTAHVTERIDFFADSADSSDLYRSRLGSPRDRNELAAWRERLGLPEIRQHFSSANALISDVQVEPQRVERCNSVLGTCYAALIIAYDIAPVYENGSFVPGTGVFTADEYKPRTRRYGLNEKTLSFEVNENGDTVIPEGTLLRIALPKNSANLRARPTPSELLNATGTPPQLSWDGPRTARFDVSFEVEDDLQTEVFGFFNELQAAAGRVLFGPEGLAVIVVAVLLFGSYVYLNKVMKK